MANGEYGFPDADDPNDDSDAADAAADAESERKFEEMDLRLHPIAERPFSEAWLHGVELFGGTHSDYFVNTRQLASRSFRSWPPNVSVIKKRLDELPSSDAIFLAAMVSFFNGDTGGKLLRGLGASGLSDIAVNLDDERRQLVADLLVSFPGW